MGDTHDLFYTDDQTMLRDTVRRFAEEVILPEATAIDRTDRFPEAIYKGLAELGLFGVCLPVDAGGAGLDSVSAAIVMEEIARCSGAVGNAFAIPVEAVVFLNEHGGDRHRALIPGLLDGSIKSATAVSEPDHGSDVAGMTTVATRDGDDYVINGAKAWVTLGRVADYFVVFAKTSSDYGGRNISCFLIEGDRDGVVRGPAEDLLGMHGLEDCMVTFSDVRIPAENRIGAENAAFKMAMRNFNFSRLMMSSMALGMAVAAFQDARDYAQDRTQFRQPIFNFQAVQFMLADMDMDISAARLLIHNAARVFDTGHPAAKEAAHAKLFTTDMAMKHINNALQIHGGNGYSKAYRVERLFRDIKLSQIYEGTNQIQRLIIARQIEKESA